MQYSISIFPYFNIKLDILDHLHGWNKILVFMKSNSPIVQYFTDNLCSIINTYNGWTYGPLYYALVLLSEVLI